MSIAERIRAFNEGRDPVRLGMKYAAMAKSAFAFFRGTSHLFWRDWGRRNALDEAPLAWSTGDLHFENFGTFKGDNRLEYFDINDFDEALLAPCVRDPVRCACSVLLAAAERGLSRTEGRALAMDFLDAYRKTIREGVIRWIERDTARGAVAALLDELTKRTRTRLLDKRTRLSGGGLRGIKVHGKYALPATRTERSRVRKLLRQAGRDDNAVSFRVLDVARRIAGTSSLGLERYVALVEGRGSPDRNYLVDIKAAAESSMARITATRRLAWESEAHRIVWIQRHMQAAAPALLRAVKMGARSYVVRELQPRQDRLRLARLSRRDLRHAVQVMGALLGWAQLRASGRRGAAGADALQDFAHRPAWPGRMLSYAASYAERVRADHELFRMAWKRGFFQGGPPKRPAT